MKKFLIHIHFLILILSAKAQEPAAFHQLFPAQHILNPASNGVRNSINGYLLYRSQWTGITGAPQTQVLHVNAPLRAYKIGIGFSAVNEQIGMRNATDISAAFSYNLKTGNTGKLSFGLKAGLKNYSFNTSKAKLSDASDALFNNQEASILFPDFGFGCYYFSKKIYAGVSLPSLFSYRFATSGALNSGIEKQASLYFHSGYFYSVSQNWVLKPEMQLFYNQASSVNAQVNANFIFKDKFTFGAGYQTSKYISFITELNLKPYLIIRYAYSYNFGWLMNVQTGTHEIRLAMDFGLETKKIPLLNTIRDF